MIYLTYKGDVYSYEESKLKRTTKDDDDDDFYFLIKNKTERQISNLHFYLPNKQLLLAFSKQIKKFIGEMASFLEKNKNAYGNAASIHISLEEFVVNFEKIYNISVRPYLHQSVIYSERD